MDDILLIQTIEKYLAREMNANDKSQFEQLRKSSPEVDQMVVEHNMFLHQMDSFSARLDFKHNLNVIHNNLLNNQDINEGAAPSLKGKVISIFRKSRKVTAIAAAVAGAIALLTSVVVSKYNTVSNDDIVKLTGAVQQQQQQITALNNEIKKSKIPITAQVKGWGSSFLVDGNGYLVTNAHVLEGATSAIVYNENGKEFNAEIAYRNNQKDLAILKINDEEFEQVKKLPFSIKKSNIDLGEEIYTIGFPNFPRTDVVYNIGYLSSIKGYNGDTLTCQIQMNANHGNSGGPVFNKRGEVIGVLSSKLNKADGVSFAIKSKGIFEIVDDLKSTDSTSIIKISTNNSLNGVDRVSQIKQIQNFVYLVKAYKK